MQVTEHGVRFPTADQTDGVAIDFTTEEGHGATGAQATGFDVGRAIVEVWKGGGGSFEEGGDRFGCGVFIGDLQYSPGRRR